MLLLLLVLGAMAALLFGKEFVYTEERVNIVTKSEPSATPTLTPSPSPPSTPKPRPPPSPSILPDPPIKWTDNCEKPVTDALASLHVKFKDALTRVKTKAVEKPPKVWVYVTQRVHHMYPPHVHVCCYFR